MTFQNTSPGLQEALNRKSFGSFEVEDLLRARIGYEGEINMQYPLERVLAIVQKHEKGALCRDLGRDGLITRNWYHDENGQLVSDTIPPESQEFSREMLDSPNFTYNAHEASTVGGYLRDRFGEFRCEVAADRILLRYFLGNVEDKDKRKTLWDTLTTKGSNIDLVRSLRDEQGEENARSIVRDIETNLLPAYAGFIDELAQSAERVVDLGYQKRLDRGIKIHQNVAEMRAKFLVRVIEAAKRRIDYEPGDMSAYYREV